MTNEEARKILDDMYGDWRTDEEREALAVAIIALKNADYIGKRGDDMKGEWVPLSERLPDEDGKMYLFTDGYNMSVERYKSDAIDHFYPQGRWFNLEEAVAWMPLPEPYKQKEGETK